MRRSSAAAAGRARAVCYDGDFANAKEETVRIRSGAMIVLAALLAGCSTAGSGADTGSGDVPLAPLPSERIAPSGAGPALGRWELTAVEGDLTIEVVAVGALCTHQTTENPPLVDESYVQLDPENAMSFKFSWASTTHQGFTYDYADRSGTVSTWTWPEGVDGQSPSGDLLVYGNFTDSTHLEGRWELNGTAVVGDCQQTNSGAGTWSAQAP